MPDAMTEIANRVRGIAVEKNFTHSRIASRLRLSRTSVSARMRGAIPWTAPELLILAGEMKVSPGRFFPDPVELVQFAEAERVSA